MTSLFLEVHGVAGGLIIISKVFDSSKDRRSGGLLGSITRDKRRVYCIDIQTQGRIIERGYCMLDPERGG